MDRVMTLCETCRDDLEIGGFRVKLIVGETTTEKKTVCEFCGQKFGSMAMKQYIVAGRGK